MDRLRNREAMPQGADSIARDTVRIETGPKFNELSNFGTVTMLRSVREAMCWNMGELWQIDEVRPCSNIRSIGPNRADTA